jgi:hypothetical protein
MHNSLKIIYWNAQGLGNKRSELIQLITHLKIDIILVNETHLNAKINSIYQTLFPTEMTASLLAAQTVAVQPSSSVKTFLTNQFKYPLHPLKIPQYIFN